MLLIAIEPSAVDQLERTGVPVTINGNECSLTRAGEFLCYHDGQKQNRCKIADEYIDGDIVVLFASSDGIERVDYAVLDAHSIIRNELVPAQDGRNLSRHAH